MGQVLHGSATTAAYNFARRLKTLKGLTPYEFIGEPSTSEPERFSLDPIQPNAGTKQLGWGWNDRENDAISSLPVMAGTSPVTTGADDRAPLAVADGVELGVQSAFRAPDTAGNIPF